MLLNMNNYEDPLPDGFLNWIETNGFKKKTVLPDYVIFRKVVRKPDQDGYSITLTWQYGNSLDEGQVRSVFFHQIDSAGYHGAIMKSWHYLDEEDNEKLQNFTTSEFMNWIKLKKIACDAMESAYS